jgi:MoaA/NifB/PqqE/SkfB family radical SAM enzyme
MIPWRNLRRFFYKALKQPGYAFGVFKKRLQANIYYFWGNGRSSYPEAVTLFLTHGCNLHCKMCGQWGREGVSKRQGAQYIQTELTLKELEFIIDNISTFKPNITLFGGEPLLHPDCIEIIKYTKQKGMHCLMITNGFLLEGLAERIIDSGLDELNISLDGSAQLHDQIRGMPGLFDKIMEGLKQINYFKSQKNKKRPLINLQCTITQYNYKYLEQMTDVANHAQADSLTFHNLIFLNRKLLNKQKVYDSLLGCNSVDWEGFIFESGIEPQILYKKMQQILSGKYSFAVDFYPNFSYQELLGYYKNLKFMPFDYSCRCLSPWIVAYILPDGELRPCLNSSYSFGNLRKDKFLQLWNNEQAVRFRQLLKEKRILPVCVRCTELYRY